MNAAINSGTVSSRPAIWRRSRAYKKKLFRRFVIGLPIVTTCGWEYRVWKRKLYYTRNREHFPGSTPFYGKMWGYESDYMIETSLSDGDIVFWTVDPLSVHVPEALARFAYRHIKGDYDCWDFCGIVRTRDSDGKKVVVGAAGQHVLYSDLVADYRTSSLAVRTLVDTSSGQCERQRIKESVPAIQDTTDEMYVHIGVRGFLDLSLKAIVKQFLENSKMGACLESLIRPASLSYPLSILSGEDKERLTEISELFMDPLIFRDSVSFSPPFFVRRLDNEYYNHNRTKNVVVDWNLLQQRDAKNKLVSKSSP